MKGHFLLLWLLFQGIASEQLGSIRPWKDRTKRDGRLPSCKDWSLSFSEVAELLIQLDVSRNVLTINPRKNCSSRNPYAQPLLLSDDSQLMHQDTTIKLQELLNWNQAAVGHQNAFLDSIMKTEAMRCLGDYLRAKGLTRNLRDVLNEYWFTEYRRDPKKTSGFEHVFQGETMNGDVTGLHNWEGLKRKGYPFCFTKIVSLDRKGYVVETRLRRGNQIKTFFVGTTPELEMALYTLCFRTSDKEHACFLNWRNFYIRTFKHRLGRKEVIEASFPVVL